MEEALLAAGLTQNEAKVYKALLKTGSAPAARITKVSGVHRVNVYDVIERLIKKGLVSSVMRTNRQYYEPANPEELLKLVEQKEHIIKKDMPNLVLAYNMRPEKQEVHYLKGPDGVLTAYYKMLEQRTTVYAIGGKHSTRRFLKHRHDKWDNERVKLKIKVKALYYESVRKEKERLKEKFFDLRYLPDEFQSPVMIDICGNLVLLLLATDTVSCIMLENKDIADGYRNYFNFMWNFAKE